MTGLLEYLPRGDNLDEKAWRRRHRLLERVLLLHVPALLGVGWWLGRPIAALGLAVIGPVVGLVLGHVVRGRRLASSFVTGGLACCSSALVGLTGGATEAHLHFFVVIGFIALYEDWVPLVGHVVVVVLGYGIGSLWSPGLLFADAAEQADPWPWSLIGCLAVVAAWAGVVIFWRMTEDERSEKEALGKQLITAAAEIGRRRFASEMLVNLARRNQSLLYRQLDIIDQLEESEQDPDVLAELFRLEHLATRIRRNAESLLVLAGEQPPRTWSASVPLLDVIRAAIAETEDLDRVGYEVDDRAAIAGHTVADLTHLLAELTENAVRFSPPESSVMIRARANPQDDGGQLLTVEDRGVGMPAEDLAAANELLARPPEVDLSVSQRLGFHVVARLAARHGIGVSLSAAPGSGVTAVVALPAVLFTAGGAESAVEITTPVRMPAVRPAGAVGPGAPVRAGAAAGDAGPRPDRVPAPLLVPSQASSPAADAILPAGADSGWTGWWSAASEGPDGHGPGSAAAAPLDPGAVPPASRPDGRPSAGTPAPHASGPLGRSLSAQPIPRPRSADDAAPPGPPASVPAGPGLRRRIPQSHLAPQLREPGPASDVPAQRPSSGAAAALSRYQASREAARALVDPEPDDEPPSGADERQQS
nr:ATP-binding protein [Pseudonocardia acidicola]